MIRKAQAGQGKTFRLAHQINLMPATEHTEFTEKFMYKLFRIW